MARSDKNCESDYSRSQSFSGLGPALGALMLLTGVFFINFISRNVTGPLLPAIESDLGINHTQAGSILFFMSIGSFTGLITSGFIAARLNYHRTIVLCMVVTGINIVLAGQSSSWAMLAGIYLLIGFSGALYIPSGLAVISKLVRQSALGRAMAVHELAPNLGLVSSPLIAELLMKLTPWRGVLTVMGLTCLLAGVVYAFRGRGGDFKPVPPTLGRMFGCLTQPILWKMVGLLVVGLSIEIGVYAMLPLYLVSERGYDLSTANYLLAASRLPGLAVVLIGGFLSDRFGWRRTAAVSLLITGVATLFLTYGPISLTPTMIFIQAAACAGFFPAALAAMSRIGPEDSRAIMVPMCLAVSSAVSGGLLPALIGFLADQNLFNLGMALPGLLCLLGIGLLPRIKLTDSE